MQLGNFACIKHNSECFCNFACFLFFVQDQLRNININMVFKVTFIYEFRIELCRSSNFSVLCKRHSWQNRIYFITSLIG